METTQFGHQLRAKERAANSVKIDLENALLGYICSGTAPVGSAVWKVLCEAIEELNNIAYHEKEEYERRD